MPIPVSNRDFLNLRAWRVTEKEMVIMNHSVTHKDCPEKKGFVRYVDFLFYQTAFFYVVEIFIIQNFSNLSNFNINYLFFQT